MVADTHEITGLDPGLHNLPGEEWVDLEVAALTLHPHVPVDEAKNCSPSVPSFTCHCMCSVAFC